MLSSDDKAVLNFLFEFRNNKLIQDEQFKAEEEFYLMMEQVASKLPKQYQKLFNDFASQAIDTIYITKEKYFEFGIVHGVATENKIMEELMAG